MSSNLQLIPERADGSSRYLEAIRDACRRGGQSLSVGKHEENCQVILRAYGEDGQLTREATGYPSIGHMLAETRSKDPVVDQIEAIYNRRRLASVLA